MAGNEGKSEPAIPAFAKLLHIEVDPSTPNRVKRLETHFMTKTKISLGRIADDAPDAKTPSAVAGTDGAQTEQADIHLGDSKKISRVHATIQWNTSKEAFEIRCLGRNGLTVDGQRLEKDELPLQLVSTAKISISGCYVIYFLLAASNPASLSAQRRAKIRSLKAKPKAAETVPAIAGGSQPSASERATAAPTPASGAGLAAKPSKTYPELITEVLQGASADAGLPFDEIASRIATAYPFFQAEGGAGGSWKSSVRKVLNESPKIGKVVGTDEKKPRYRLLPPGSEEALAKLARQKRKADAMATTPTPSGGANSQPEDG